MKKQLTVIYIIIILFFSPTKNFAQLSLGTIERFSLFSVSGAVSNTGTSSFKGKGNIGSYDGTISGFAANTYDGNIYLANSDTARQAKIDLLNIYILLNNVPVTYSNYTNLITGRLTAGVYDVLMAGSASGAITLDAQNDPNAIFILKFEGAFNITSGSTISLINGARSCNVFWISEGAVSIGTGCTAIGTLISHPGAVTLGSGSTLEGRMLSTTGAVNVNASAITLPKGPNSVSIDCITSCNNSILGTAANFALFSISGTVANTGISGIIGDVGSDAGGTVSGFETSTLIGQTQYANAATNQAKTDLLAACTTLSGMASNKTHDPIFKDETLYAGIYKITGASSLSGTVTLDGEGNSGAQFVFQVNAAFTVTAQSKVILKNGAQRCNIFWIAEGAISMETFAFMKGNVIAHNAANSMGANGFLEGRMFSTTGAVTFNTATTYISNSLCAASSPNYIILANEITLFTANCENKKIVLKWNTSSEINNKDFTIERSSDGTNWSVAGIVAGSVNSAIVTQYLFIDNPASQSLIYYYRLKQTSQDNNIKYSSIIAVKMCAENTDEERVSFFPNPSTGEFNLIFTGDKRKVSSTKIYNLQGVKIYQSIGFPSKFNLSNQPDGMYLILVNINSKIISRKIIIKNK